jgi:tetratricopeptide (TPR) repeat protein
MKFVRLLILCLLFVELGYSQFTEIDCNLTQAFISQKMGTFNIYIKQLDDELAKKYSADLQFKRMKVTHFYIAYLFAHDGDSDEIERQITALEKDLIALEQSSFYAQKCLGFRAAFSAYEALQSPLTAIYYLPKSFSLAKDAIKSQPTSPYSWAEYGNLEYCYSLYFGGDYKEAINAFAKAITIFEKQGLANPCNWYYINTLLFLAKSYEDNKQLAEANTVYDKMLRLTPGFTAINRWKHNY